MVVLSVHPQAALAALAACSTGSPAYYHHPGSVPVQRSYASYPPPVQLWFLTPAEVADLITRIPLADYREVSPDAPVAARDSADDHQT